MSRLHPMRAARALALGLLLLSILIAARPAPAAEPAKAAAQPSPGQTAEARKLAVTTDQVLDVAYLPDGRRFVCATGSRGAGQPATDYSVQLWDLATGKRIYRYTGHESDVKRVVVAPDGHTAASASGDKTIRLWDLDTGAAVGVVHKQGTRLLSLAFSPDGRRVLSGSWDKRPLHYVDVASRKNVLLFGEGTGPVQCAVVTADGRRALSAHTDKMVRLWDLETGQEVRRFEGHERPVFSVLLTPDGGRALSGARDGTIRLWDLETGKPLSRFLVRVPSLNCVALSPDGRQVISGGGDGMVRLWDAETGAAVGKYAGHTDSVQAVAFAPDGGRALSAGGDGTVRLWDLNVAPAPANASPVVARAEKVAEPPAAPAPTSLAGLKRDGAFGFPQSHAKVLCDQDGVLRVSVWNNTEFLYVQAIVWGDSEDVVSDQLAGQPLGDWSHLNLDLDADHRPTARIDRNYTLNPWPRYPGLHYQVKLGPGRTTTLMGDSRGRGAIRHVDVGDGRRVRVDSYAIPLSEIRKRPGEKICLGYWGSSQAPALAFNSVGFEAAGFYPDFALPIAMYHEITLSERAAAFDIALVPEARKEPLPAPAQVAARAGAAANAAEPRSTTPPRSTPAVDTFLSELRNTGQGGRADELTAEINQAHETVERFRRLDPARTGHVIVGRVLVAERDDPSKVIAQMRPHPDGLFVGPVAASGRPVTFRRQGYLPAEVTPTGEPGTVEYVGEVRLQPLPESHAAAVSGKVVLEGDLPARGVTAKLMLDVGRPINTPSNAAQGYFPDLVNLDVTESGVFSGRRLSPTDYFLMIAAQGHVNHIRPITLKPGQTLDAGTITLERAIPVAVTYRVAASPPFTQSHTEHQKVLGGGQFRSNPQDRRVDLNFTQGAGELRFLGTYLPCSIADLGPGKLDDFLEVDPASARFTQLGSIYAHPGHVYLLNQQAIKHWVLFQVDF